MFKEKKLSILCEWLFTSMYVCVPHACLVPRGGHERALGILEQVFVSLSVGAGDGTQVPWKSVFNHQAISAAPKIF